MMQSTIRMVLKLGLFISQPQSSLVTTARHTQAVDLPPSGKYADQTGLATLPEPHIHYTIFLNLVQGCYTRLRLWVGVYFAVSVAHI